MEVVTNLQREILQHFGQVSESDQFYLTGGTALAHFYLKHRRSNDLDFFTSTEEIINPFSRRFEEKFKTLGMVVQRQRGFASFVELLVHKDKESTIVQFALDAAFRFEPTRTFSEYPLLRVDGLVDIASNKALALFGRATLRDFIDLYTLVRKNHFQQEELLDKAKKKDPGFDLYWFGVALERIKTFDEKAPEMLLLSESIPFQELLTFFNRWREGIAKEL